MVSGAWVRGFLPALVMVAAWAGAAFAGGWLSPESDLRVGLVAAGDLQPRDAGTMECVSNFNDLLGADRTCIASSLVLFDPDTNQKVALDVAQDTELRYPSGNPILQLKWSAPAIPALGDKRWELYFRTVSPGAPGSRSPLAKTFSPSNILMTIDFEKTDPKRPGEPMFLSRVGRDEGGEKTEMALTDKEAHGGTHSLRIARVTQPGITTGNTNRPFWWTYPPSIPVTEGAMCRVSGWVKSVKLSRGAQGWLVVQYYDEKKANIGGKEGHFVARGPEQTSDWSYVVGSQVVPKKARYAGVQVGLALDGEIYWDDIALEMVSGSNAPPLAVTTDRIEKREDFQAGPKPETPSDGKVLRVALAKQPPRLDGVLDDPCWAEAEKITDFFVHGRAPGQPLLPTAVLACADQDAIYFAFECMEPQADQIIAKGVGRDGNIWHDDSVEIFLNTNGDGQSFYQIAFNAKGSLFDQDTGLPGLPGEAWNGPIEVAAKIGKDRWTAEVKIGFVGLRLAEAQGQVWTGNFCRTSMRGGDRTLYTWAKVMKDFGEPKTFNKVVLPFDPTVNAVSIRPAAGDRLFYGKGDLPVMVMNRRANPVSVKICVTAKGKGPAYSAGEVAMTLDPKSRREVAVPCAFPRSEQVALTYELREQPGDRLLYVTSGEGTVRNPLDVKLVSNLSYLNEPKMTALWQIGLAPGTLPKSRLVLSLKDASVSEKISPSRPEGDCALDVSRLATGSYALQAELLSGDEKIASKTITFLRITGPFSERD